MKVTDDPGQKGFGLAAMKTPAGRPILPVMVIVFDVAGFPDVQGREEVITQVTRSPDTGL